MIYATQKQIARKLGVSRQAVGFALSDDPDIRKQLSEATRNRIRKAAQKMGYTQHRAALAIKSGRTQIVGVAGHVARTSSTLDRLTALSQVFSENNYRILFSTFESHCTQQEQDVIEDLLAHRVDGLVVLNPSTSDLSCYTRLHDRGFPLVMLSGDFSEHDLPRVLLDTGQGKYDLACHLIELGHRRIAFAIGQFKYHASNPHSDWNGFTKAMHEADLPVVDSWMLKDELVDRESVARFTGRVLDGPDRPTAIMYTNDEMALVGLHAIMARGLRVPRDISITGYDDFPLASLVSPTLTTANQNYLEQSRIAFAMLQHQMDSQPMDDSCRMLIPPQLVIRQSTGAVNR
ncbi:MAG: LacI family DNA-binding transcriptional regulator [Phycisphaeraceae bacterium]|nr:LacI family DNA-binding transcriptional regulator [Phycisphaeraceae bacterium]